MKKVSRIGGPASVIDYRSNFHAGQMLGLLPIFWERESVARFFTAVSSQQVVIILIVKFPSKFRRVAIVLCYVPMKFSNIGAF